MNYAVDFSSRAEDELAQLWVNASDRNAVTSAADEIERLLASDPLAQGESRGGDKRLIFEQPPAALYRVDAKRRTVTVVTVGLAAPPR